MKRAFALCILMLLSATALADTTPRALADNFFAILQKGQAGPAYAKLFEGSNVNVEQATAIRRSTENTLAPLGKMIGAELVREEVFGTSLTRLVYLLKSERHLTLWEFYFYKPANRWFVAEVNLSQKFSDIGPKK